MRQVKPTAAPARTRRLRVIEPVASVSWFVVVMAASAGLVMLCQFD
jgi:hypothetical protein